MAKKYFKNCCVCCTVFITHLCVLVLVFQVKTRYSLIYIFSHLLSISTSLPSAKSSPSDTLMSVQPWHLLFVSYMLSGDTRVIVSFKMKKCLHWEFQHIQNLVANQDLAGKLTMRRSSESYGCHTDNKENSWVHQSRVETAKAQREEKTEQKPTSKIPSQSRKGAMLYPKHNVEN